jgi:hypothetical protein
MKRRISARWTGLLMAFVASAGIAGLAQAAPAKVADEGREVAYAELEKHVGEEIVVRTTFDTTRRGTLTGYTTVSVSMKLGPEAGSIDLTVPKETIRSVRVIGPAAPAIATEGASAEKN